MKMFLLCLCAVFTGVIFGPLIKDSPGFVVIAYQNITIEIRLWVTISLILLTFFVLLFFIYCYRRFSYSGHQFKNWLTTSRWKKSRKHTIQGMISLAEGDWLSAEKYSLIATKNSDTKLLNYLAAAQAAQQLNSNSRRDEYLRLASEHQPDASIAIHLTQAQLQIQHHQYEQALATLSHLQNIAPKHTHVLKLLLKVYQKLEDWNQILVLLPKLIQLKIITKKESESLQLKAYRVNILKASTSSGLEATMTIWADISTPLRKNPLLVNLYAELLIGHNAHAEAEQLLRESIRRCWDENSVYLFGKVQGNDLSQQLSTAETWLKYQNNCPTLLLTLGRLCLKNELWGKAQHYLTESNKLRPLAETYLELARAMEELNLDEKALLCYKQGLLIKANTDFSILAPNQTNSIETKLIS